ncbi:MAG: tRNA lysidine(34) synthetase TilS [Methylophaga sp.]|nr:tRNA lysidine(34) synthetase TilS [Methylophaga sp.]
MQNLTTSLEDIYSLANNKEIWVAYSGGVDSHVLLHLLAALNSDQSKSINAIHIDHGLHPESLKWTQHCASVAIELGVEFTSIQVNVIDIDKLGLEAAARTARYNAFEQNLTKNDVLLTAQHQQDQAETLLLQLFRGAGPKGLASMASQFQLGETTIFRPLLNVKQIDLIAYAEQHKLQWIEDPSNVETRWNRNYIRHNVMPEIEKRWPSVAKTISRSAENCAEASQLLTELAQHDLAEIGGDSSLDYLAISKLLALSPPRCRNLIRHFIEWKKLALPSSAVLQGIIEEVCLAKQDSVPMMAYADVEIRRFQDKLYFMSPLPELDVSQIIEFNSSADLKINTHMTLSWQQTDGQGLNKETITAGLTVRFRQGGEQIQLPKQSHHKSLKHLFQEWEIPPWQRGRIPLLFSGDRLVAIVAYVIDNKSGVVAGDKGYSPRIVVGK